MRALEPVHVPGWNAELGRGLRRRVEKIPMKGDRRLALSFPAAPRLCVKAGVAPDWVDFHLSGAFRWGLSPDPQQGVRWHGCCSQFPEAR